MPVRVTRCASESLGQAALPMDAAARIAMGEEVARRGGQPGTQ